MYNRYIPGTNGIYQREILKEPHSDAAEAPLTVETAAQASSIPASARSSHALDFDLGDLLLLCVILLLLIDSDQNDSLTLLITAAAFILLS